MIRDREMIGYIPDNTHNFICIHCVDKADIDLNDIGEIENTVVLRTDDWKDVVGPCVDCGTLASQVRP